jgi:predicted ATPase
LLSDSGQLRALEHLDTLASHILSSSSSLREFSGVYLHGGVGCGKTMLMDLFYTKLRTDNVKNIKRTHFHPFMIDVHARLHNLRYAKGGRGTADPLPIVAQQIVEENRIICFDELLVMDVADAMILRHLFNSMFMHGAVIVATSNAAPRNLYKNGINRDVFLPFIQLIETKCKVHDMDIKTDYRGKIEIADSNKGVFFGLSGEKMPKSVQDARKFAISRLLGIGVNEVPEPVPREITVISGRKVQIQNTYFRNTNQGKVSIAEFDFMELFGKAMHASASDFLAISENFNVILVYNVPEINPSEESIARRMITGLDVWYDHKKTVVLISKCSPQSVLEKIRISLGIGSSQASPSVSSSTEVSRKGGSTSQFSSTMINTPEGKQVEWSGTGLKEASMANLSKSKHDEELLLKRATSRMTELQNRGNFIVIKE